MKAYITGKGLVSAMGNGKEKLALPEVTTPWLAAVKPEFTKYFEAKQARRTSKILKMGLVASFDALNQNLEDIDGIIVGTGIGCIGDSEKFIVSLIKYEETMLSPTPFIQSTHNTIAGSIALQLKVHQYNFTYSERVFSFEWTLLDALLQINESAKEKKFLVGTADELTERTFYMAKSLGLYQDYDAGFVDIKTQKSSRVFGGEHAAFFTLNTSGENQACLHFVKMYFQRKMAFIIPDIQKEIQKAAFDDVDCVLLGINGHQAYDKVYDSIETAFPTSSLAYFKHLCGESLTASSFAFWLATEILEKGELEEIITIKNSKKPIKNILILNHFKKDYFSAIFLSI